MSKIRSLIGAVLVAAGFLVASVEPAQAQFDYGPGFSGYGTPRYYGYSGGYGIRSFSYTAGFPGGPVYGYGTSYPGFFPPGAPNTFSSYYSSTNFGLGGVGYGYGAYSPGVINYSYPGYYYRPGYLQFFNN